MLVAAKNFELYFPQRYWNFFASLLADGATLFQIHIEIVKYPLATAFKILRQMITGYWHSSHKNMCYLKIVAQGPSDDFARGLPNNLWHPTVQYNKFVRGLPIPPTPYDKFARGLQVPPTPYEKFGRGLPIPPTPYGKFARGLPIPPTPWEMVAALL
jgi:hypothetical protein